MAKPYSDDLRERAVLALEAGYTRVEVAELFGLSLSSVGRYTRRKRETGSVSPEKFGGYKRSALEPHADLVRSARQHACGTESTARQGEDQRKSNGKLSISTSAEGDI